MFSRLRESASFNRISRDFVAKVRREREFSGRALATARGFYDDAKET